MAIRKSVEENFVVSGKREDWLTKCDNSLKSNGFKNIKTSNTIFQITADYKKATCVGEILVTLQPDGDNTKINAKATANTDNIFALFKSPGKTILEAFKSGIV